MSTASSQLEANAAQERAEEAARIFGALSDATRVRILNLLAAGELCVCDLVEVLEQPQPTVSRHLTRLRELGLVNVRRRGRFAYYRLARPEPGPARDLLGLVRERLAAAGLGQERESGAELASARAIAPCPE